MKHILIETPYYQAFRSNNIVVIDISLEHGDSTDAVPGRYPSHTGRKVGKDGTVNYFEDADDDAVNRWKRTLGSLLTEHVVRPEVLRREGEWIEKADRAVLLHFPDGFQLFAQKRGDRHTPRTDYYLMGSRYVHAFRSPKEFFLHAKWLMEGRPLKADGARDCGCCYCDSTSTQGDISRRYHFGVPAVKPQPPKDSEHADKEQKRGIAKPVWRPKARLPQDIPAKDYTKLNLQNLSINDPS